MTILITIIILMLFSFWILGYTYQYYNSRISLKARKIREKEKKLQMRIEGLEKEKRMYEKKISELKEQIAAIEERLKEIEAMKNISL